MKIHKSFHHFTRKEQRLLRGIRNKIIEYVNPLIIYCLTSISTTVIEQSCFSSAGKIEEWNFECDLLVVLAGDIINGKDVKKEIEASLAGFGQVTVFIYPLDVVIQQIKVGHLFFRLARECAVVLYEKGNATGLVGAAEKK